MPAADQKVRRPTSPTTAFLRQKQQQQRLSVDFDRGIPSAGCQLQCCSPLRRPQLNRNAVSEYTSSVHVSQFDCSSGADGVYDEQTDEIVTIDDFGDLIDQATFEQVSYMNAQLIHD